MDELAIILIKLMIGINLFSFIFSIIMDEIIDIKIRKNGKDDE